MGILNNVIYEKTHTRKKTSYTANCHIYGNDAIADGFVSPIVYPSMRIENLVGENVAEAAAKCGLSEEELSELIISDYAEPSVSQLMRISKAFGVSVFWLLGYHCNPDDRSGDGDIIRAISQRNSAEAAAESDSTKGMFGSISGYFRNKRKQNAVYLVANTAARITVRQHYPLSPQVLYTIKGQPVFIEYTDGATEWGIVSPRGILTADETLPYADVGVRFIPYITPKFV